MKKILFTSKATKTSDNPTVVYFLKYHLAHYENAINHWARKILRNRKYGFSIVFFFCLRSIYL